MEKEEKTSPFTSFVENFELIVSTIKLEEQQLLEVYWKLINYLDKHLIYRKLASHYVFIALNLVNKYNQTSEIVTKLIIKAIYTDNFNDDAIDVLNK